MSNINEILIYGAKSNNLKNLDLKIPRDKLVVITGLSAVVNHLWHLTLSMLKDKGDILKHSLLTQDSFCQKWRDLKLIKLRGYPLL